MTTGTGAEASSSVTSKQLCTAKVCCISSVELRYLVYTLHRVCCMRCSPLTAVTGSCMYEGQTLCVIQGGGGVGNRVYRWSWVLPSIENANRL